MIRIKPTNDRNFFSPQLSSPSAIVSNKSSLQRAYALFPIHSLVQFKFKHNALISLRSRSRRRCPLGSRHRLRGYLLLTRIILFTLSLLSKVTAPVATTSWPAGQPATVTWQDDGNSPTLQSFGPCLIGLYAGSQSQQVYTIFRFLVFSRLIIIHRLSCKLSVPTLTFLPLALQRGLPTQLWAPTTTLSECNIPTCELGGG